MRLTDHLLRAGAINSTPTTIVLPTLLIKGKTWYDGETPYVHRLVSYLSALRDNRTEDDWHAYCQWALKTGFKGLRTFGGYRVDQEDPWAALAKLPRYIEVVSSYGLVLEFSALTGTGDCDYDPEQYLAESAEIIRPFCDHVILELANEYEHGSQNLEYEDLKRWGASYCEGLCWAVGAPPEDEPTPEGVWNGAGGTYGTAHLDRGRDFWNQCRRVREIFACTDTGTPVLDNEPLGADEVDGSVSGKQRSNDPAFFACLGALDRGFPGVGGVHHNQAGLDAVLPGPVQQQCAEAYVAAHLAVEEILTNHIPQYKNAGHVDSPVLSFANAVREYSFTIGNSGVTVGVGEAPGVSIQWGNRFSPKRTVYDICAADGCHLVVREVSR